MKMTVLAAILGLLTMPDAPPPTPGCAHATGSCCCKMSNGLECCGPASKCPSTAISGCPCARPTESG